MNLWEMFQCPPTGHFLGFYFTSVTLWEGRCLCFLRAESTKMTVGFPVWTKNGGEMRAIRFLSGRTPDVQTGHSTSANQNGPCRETLGCWGLFTYSWLCFSLLLCVVPRGRLVRDHASTRLDKQTVWNQDHHWSSNTQAEFYLLAGHR